MATDDGLKLTGAGKNAGLGYKMQSFLVNVRLPFTRGREIKMINLSKRQTGAAIVIIAISLVVFLSLLKVNNDKKNGLICGLGSQVPGYDMTKCPAHNGQDSWLFVANFSVALLMVAFGLYLIIADYFSRVKALEPSFKPINVSSLDEDQKVVYHKLKDNKGSMFQSQLVTETQFGKVKMTRILDSLEQQGILERKRRGMTNLVVLK